MKREVGPSYSQSVKRELLSNLISILGKKVLFLSTDICLNFYEFQYLIEFGIINKRNRDERQE